MKNFMDDERVIEIRNDWGLTDRQTRVIFMSCHALVSHLPGVNKATVDQQAAFLCESINNLAFGEFTVVGNMIIRIGVGFSDLAYNLEKTLLLPLPICEAIAILFSSVIALATFLYPDIDSDDLAQPVYDEIFGSSEIGGSWNVQFN